MRSIFLIFAAAGFSSFCLQADERNYSLWPQRPAAVSEAVVLLENGEDPEKACRLAQSCLHAYGIGGREARRIVGCVNVRKYLSGNGSWLTEQTVQRGDTLFRLANRLQCPVDVLIYLNHMASTSLRAGQKIKIPARPLLLEIRLDSREVLVWDDETLVAAYPIVSSKGTETLSGSALVESRIAFLQGGRVEPAQIMSYVSADKQIVLSGGKCRIASLPDTSSASAVIHLAREDCNELALLLKKGNKVRILQGG